MNTQKTKKTLTLLVHQRMAYEWCKPILSEFSQRAPRSGFSLHVVHTLQDIPSPNSPVVLLGVDQSWLYDCLQKLDAAGRKTILMSGFAEKKSSHVSRIIVDHDDLIKKSIAHLKACGCSSIAFFGVQKDDTADKQKAQSFLSFVPKEHVFEIRDTLDECFQRLNKSLPSYDGIICSNDIVAVYLLARCKELGISVPEKLRIIGNGNLWISAHTAPKLTTVSEDVGKAVAITLRMCRDFYSFDDIASFDIYMKASLQCRASTGYEEKKAAILSAAKVFRFFTDEDDTDPDLMAIKRIERTLCVLSLEQQQILDRYLRGEAYADISEKLHVSEDTLRYHIKKIYKSLHVHSKKECVCLLKKYLGGMIKR